MGLCITLGVSLAMGTPVHAQEASRKQKAAEFFSLGVKHFEAAEYEQALEAFERAYRMAPHHAVRVNMAACFAKLGRPVEALFNYERFLHESAGNAPPAQKRTVEEAMAELEGQVGEVKLQVGPAKARVHIDGQPPRTMPDGRVLMAEGTYQVEVFAPGYESYEGTLDVQGGAEAVVDVTLQPAKPGSAPATTAEVPADSDAWADFQASPSYDNRRTWKKPLTRYVIGATGLAFLVGSVVTGGLTIKANNDRDAALLRAMDPNARTVGRIDAQLDAIDAQELADAARAATYAQLGVGLALETAAMTLWLLARKRERGKKGPDESAWLRPAVGPGFAGISLSNSF